MDADLKRENAMRFAPADTDHLRRVDRLVGAALDLPREARQQFLLESCGGDAKLHQDAVSLLASCEMAEATPNFLEGTAADLATPVMEDLLTQSAPSDAAMAPVLAAALVDRYAVVRGIGSGGAANVYLADDRTNGRQVAIKVLRPELAETTAATRFVREIHLMSMLEHPRIVPVLDAGEVAGISYYVLPYMDGRSLRDRLTRDKQLPIDEAVAIAIALADALAYAHHHGTIHRDVKPENILFSGGEAHLADFGIARALERAHGESSTTTGLVRGTVPYMSPEQASGSREIDRRSDVYALGCVLYEMLAGMPAFVGPSPEAILAQKLLHPPRDLHIYRPNVSPRLSALVMRALQVAPADRFRSAGDFAEALRGLAPEDWSVADAPARGSRPRQRGVLLAGLALAALIVGPVVVSPSARAWLRQNLTSQHPDTTIVAVLPLERGAQAKGRPLDDDQLLREAMARWRGVTLVDRFLVSDALRRRGSNLSSVEASSVAASLGAGRYVRGTIEPQGDTWRVSVGLFDVGRLGLLRESWETVPDGLGAATAAYARLSRKLLVREVEPDSLGVDVAPTNSLPAAQALGRAQLALDAWDLAAADSAFQTAVSFDPDYTRASLLLAQVRAWRGLPARSWTSLADRASANEMRLAPRERDLAAALVLLGHGRFENACGVYDGLRRKNERDFAAWFGLGMCRTMDHAVVRDSTSPLGRRFRSSYHSALLAYTTAFEILPSMYRSYERGAFDEVLQLLLPVGTEVVAGYGIEGDSARYSGRPVWNAEGDSLVLIPYPPQSVAMGAVSTTPPGFGQALERLHRRFRTIAAGWSAAYPRSAGAKQAVAISLELDGDPRAIDTMNLARRLAIERPQKIELGAAEVLLRVKFGSPSDVAQLTTARILADSLLRVDSPTAAEAEALAPLATLTGRCDQAEQLVRGSNVPSYGVRIAEQIAVAVQILAVRLALGCPETRSVPQLGDLATAIARDPGATRGPDRKDLDTQLLFRPALYSMPLDSALIDRLARSIDHPLVRAALALTHGDTAQARSTLSEFRNRMRVRGAPWTPDMEFPIASLLVASGDTLTALEWLSRRLEEVRSLDPKVLRDPVKTAAFIRATIMRADLANGVGDSAGAKQWATISATLWKERDAGLSGVANRMTRYTRMP